MRYLYRSVYLLAYMFLLMACGGGSPNPPPVDGAWQGPVLTENDETGGASNVRLKVGRNGHAVVSWSVFHGAGLTDVFVNHYDPAAGWQGAQAPSRDIESITQPDMQLAVDSAGNALGVWGERQSSLPDQPSTFFATTYDAGTATWSAAEAMENDNTGKAQSLAVASGPGGSFWVLFGLNMGTTVEIHVNHYTPAGGWSGPVLLATEDWDPADSYLSTFDIAVDDSGNAVAGWSRYTDTDSSGTIDRINDRQSVFARYYNAGTATWSFPTDTLNASNDYNAYIHDIQVDPTGGFLVLWSQYNAAFAGWANFYRGGVLQPAVSLWDYADGYYPSGAGFDSAGNAFVFASEVGIIATFRYQAALGWQSPVILQPDSGYDKSLADFAVSAGGDAFALWRQEISSDWEVFVRRYDFSQDTWETAVNIDSPNSGDVVSGAKIVSDAAGNATAAWHVDDGVAMSYYAVRYFKATDSLGDAIEIDNGALDTVQYGTCIGVDGSGTVMAAWAQGAASDEDIYSNLFD